MNRWKGVSFDSTNKEKTNTFDSVSALSEGGELILNAFKKGIFPIKATKSKGSPSDLARVSRVATVSDHLNIKSCTNASKIALSQYHLRR